MAMKIIEVTARGFNGENDDTDDRVLWCKFDSAAQAETWLDDIGAPYQSVSETSVKPHEGNADCLSHSELVAALFGFVVADMRAALQPFADLLEYPLQAPAEIELNIHSNDVHAAHVALEVAK